MKTKAQQLQQVFLTMKYAFVVVPVVAGADKFSNILTNWADYVNPSIGSILPFSAATFMMIVGIIEIVAGLIVWKKPEFGGYLVALWLCGIALSLLAGWMYVDVAVRDLVMALAAFSMARLSKLVD